MLDHLGLDPVKFVRRALATENELELDRPPGEAPQIVARAWARVRAGSAGSGIGETYLETLDRQRYEEPTEVIRLVSWAVDHVELALLPRLLGVAGSAWRLRIHLDEAEHALHAGLEIARRRDDQKTVGKLLQRLSYVIADRGDRAEALRLAEKAVVILLRHGDRESVAGALVDQGLWLYYLGRAEAAVESLKTALEYLPDGPSRNRMAALHCMGLAHQSLGNLNAALETTLAAPQAAEGIDVWDKAKLLWLRARICTDLGQLEQASQFFGEVIATFRPLHHGETALATCELVRVQLLQDRPEQAYQTATSMRALLEPLKHNQIISIAIGDLLRSGRAGLTLALVKRAMFLIQGERQRRRAWQSLCLEASHWAR